MMGEKEKVQGEHNRRRFIVTWCLSAIGSFMAASGGYFLLYEVVRTFDGPQPVLWSLDSVPENYGVMFFLVMLLGIFMSSLNNTQWIGIACLVLLFGGQVSQRTYAWAWAKRCHAGQLGACKTVGELYGTLEEHDNALFFHQKGCTLVQKKRSTSQLQVLDRMYGVKSCEYVALYGPKTSKKGACSILAEDCTISIREGCKQKKKRCSGNRTKERSQLCREEEDKCKGKAWKCELYQRACPKDKPVKPSSRPAKKKESSQPSTTQSP